ncbi:hypothetical protein CSZ94_18935 [Janthinobacterium sp. ROICE36]|uniref:hypothetical protein n=1 Tax=Janthinobacterium sp. ROICE36 TaxID=2048670 RepID=UPI000C7ECF5F|nr:hypothetical protein [Janthinobacterium sp. ROICE36]PLY40798.1 hypothetical protein CSZ94_18935 [Janthinobacterium sp. ROICE36]
MAGWKEKTGRGLFCVDIYFFPNVPLSYIDNHFLLRRWHGRLHQAVFASKMLTHAGRPIIHVYLFSTRGYDIFFIES